MELPEQLYTEMAPFILVLARVGGLFVFAPVLSSASIPAKFKAMLAFMFAVLLFPLVPPEAPEASRPDVFLLGALVGREALFGIFIGLVAALPLYAMQLGGLLMDHQIGMGLAQVYNPALDTESSVIGDMMLTIATGLFISIGGLDAVFLGVARTLTHLPIGASAFPTSTVDMITGLVSSGFELAQRISAPVLGVILLETVATSLVSKTMPQINLMSSGFAVKIIAGLVMLVAALSPINNAVADAIWQTLSSMLDWSAGVK